MKNFSENSKNESIIRPTVLEVNLKNIENNILQFKKKLKGLNFMAVVKANAYGLGSIEVSNLAIRCGAKYLCVATIEEGIEIRNKGIDIPILVLGGILPGQYNICSKYNLDFTISNMLFFRQLCSSIDNNSVIKLHLNIDTGMNRIGISPDEIYQFIYLYKKHINNIKLNGIWTHFPSADSSERSFSLKQIEIFKKVVNILKKEVNEKIIVHAANSAATISIPESYFDMVRIGLGLYGYYDNIGFKNIIDLQPAVTWKTGIVCIRQVAKGESIGYGRTYITVKNSKIGTIPVGYADGYNRLLSNRGFVLVNGKRANVVGRVCMDQTMIDLSDINDVHEGEDVILLGAQGNDTISMYKLCELIDTIPNEVLVNISKRVPRVYI
jgi:alanine racemase